MLQIVTAIFSMVGKKDDMKDADPKEKVEKIFSLMDTVSLLLFLRSSNFDPSSLDRPVLIERKVQFWTSKLRIIFKIGYCFF